MPKKIRALEKPKAALPALFVDFQRLPVIVILAVGYSDLKWRIRRLYLHEFGDKPELIFLNIGSKILDDVSVTRHMLEKLDLVQKI